MLPRYPSDKVVLMELARQMVYVHEKQSSSQRLGFKFSLSIRRYSINSVFKARAMDEEMRRITMRFSSARKDFDYRGMNNKLKRSYTHGHMIEYIWIECRSGKDIKKLDYCHLTKEHIIDINLADVPEDLHDDGDILEPVYEANKIDSTPLPLI